MVHPNIYDDSIGLISTDTSSHIIDLHRSTRVSEPPARLKEFHCYFSLATLHKPCLFCKASSHPRWQEAMSEELHALTNTRTWDLVDLPLGKIPIYCK